jgi:hypothetical protein
MATSAQNYIRAGVPAWVPVLLGFTGLALFGVTLSNFNPHLVLHLALFAAGLAITCAAAPREDAPTLLAAYVSAYLLRVVTIVIVQQLAPGGLILLDDRAYDEQARYMASGWSLPNLAYAASDLGTSHTGYPILLGSLYGLLGPSVTSAKFLNAFFGALTVPVTYSLAIEVCGNRNAARTAAWLTAVFLYDAMWAGFLLKDSILLCLFTTTVLCLVRFGKTHRLTPLVAGCGLLLLLQLFRFYSVAVLALAGLTGLVVFATRDRLPRSLHGRIAIAVLGVGVAAAGGWLVMVHYGDAIDTFSAYARAIEHFDASGYTLLRFTPDLAFVQQFLKAALVYQLGPFPWVFSGVGLGILFYPGMYLIYALLPFCLLGFGKLARELDGCRAFVLAAWLLHAVVEIFMYQAGERQRITVDALFITCAAVGWSGRSGKWRFVAATYGALLALAIAHIIGGSVF